MASFFHAVPYLSVGRSDREKDAAVTAMGSKRIDINICGDIMGGGGWCEKKKRDGGAKEKPF